MIEAPNAWVLLIFGDHRQYAGNLGYSDDVARIYRYDSFVPNHRQLKRGDVVILQDRRRILGYARVEEIVVSEGSKMHRRCPQCDTTGIKERRYRHPRFRCNNAHEFENPREDEVICNLYSAFFGESFTPEPEEVFARDLALALHAPAGQQAIRRLDLQKLSEGPLARTADHLALLASRPQKTYLLGSEAARNESPEAGYSPSEEDARRLVMRRIRERRGQASFRRALRHRYGDKCLVSGCSLVDLLEAAHITPFRNLRDNHPENGLLLRADIHTLFDLDLIGIEPWTFVIRVHPATARSGYGYLDGKPLGCGDRPPSADALARRWGAFVRRSRAELADE